MIAVRRRLCIAEARHTTENLQEKKETWLILLLSAA
jgi:hypothetical protein